MYIVGLVVSLFSIKLFKRSFGNGLLLNDVSHFHAQKGHASPDRDTIGTHN